MLIQQNNVKPPIPSQVNLSSEQLDVQHELSSPRKSKVYEKAFSGGIFISHRTRIKYFSGGDGKSRGVSGGGSEAMGGDRNVEQTKTPHCWI